MSTNTGPGAQLEVGRIVRAHGLRGDVVIAPISNRPERFRAGSKLSATDRIFEIVQSRAQQQQFVVHLAGVDSREAAEALRGTLLCGDPLGPLPDDELWVHELIGCTCVDASGTSLGSVVAVQDNPAHDLVMLDGGELIPMVFVVSHDVVRRLVVVDPPDGLIELFR